MLNNNFIGFDAKKEFLPKDFDEFNSTIKLRQLFLNLINNIFKCSCQFSKYEQTKLSKYSIESAFKYKINNLMPYNFVKKSNKEIVKSFKLCIDSTKIINNYLNPNKQESILVSNKNILPLAKIISICFTNNKMQLLIDKHLLFHEFVLKKLTNLLSFP